MLGKLLKYDFKNMYKFLSVFYILAIISGITTRIFFSLKNTGIVYIISQISVGFMFAIIANIIINNTMRIWVRFKETIYSDEAYLTHTLPVEKKQIFNSKFLLSLITLITSFIVILLTLFIAYYTKDRMILLKEYISNISGSLEISNFLFITVVSILLFLEIFSAIQVGYLGTIIGHKKDDRKTFWSIAYSFIIYMITQLIVLLVIFITGLFNSNVMDLFKTSVINLSSLKLVFVVSVITYLAFIFVIKKVAIKLLEKGVNVD